jgi:DNA-directed RNA polymerase subunit RPC12/RpoP
MSPSSQIIDCLSPDCGRPFHVAAFHFLDTSWERGVIRCPHCGTNMVGASESVFLAFAMTDKDEARHLSK